MTRNLRRRPLFHTPARSGTQYKSRKWSVLRILKKALARTCMALGALMLISIISSAVMVIMMTRHSVPSVPDTSVLILSVDGNILERERALSLSDPFPGKEMTVRQLTAALRNAAADKRVKGVVVSIRAGGIDLVTAQEVRSVIKEFKESGKFVRSFTTSFGDAGNSFASYYLAAAASEIWMQPVGSLTIAGVSSELPLAQTALADLGINAQFSKRKEYKSAVIPFTQSEIDEHTEQMMQALVNDIGAQVVGDIAQDRNMRQEKVKALVDQGLLLDTEALAAGLLDRLEYGDVLVREIKEQISGDADSEDVSFLGLKEYAARVRLEKETEKTKNRGQEKYGLAQSSLAPKDPSVLPEGVDEEAEDTKEDEAVPFPNPVVNPGPSKHTQTKEKDDKNGTAQDFTSQAGQASGPSELNQDREGSDRGLTPSAHRKPKVALIYVTGAIVPQGDSVQQAPVFPAANQAAADKISDAIFQASRMKDVEAIILRVNSPGGSPSASETIRRAVVVAKERGKTVVVSMGALAASGGYWITPDADLIVANPATLTGSIGVVGGKFVLEDMWEKLKINWAHVNFGKNAGMWSPNRPFDPAQWRRFNQSLDSIYEQFVVRVAQGRGMSVEEVEKVAKGRVWTGRQALAAGLVDRLGSLDTALEETARMIGLEGQSDFALIELPRRETLSEKLIRILQQQVAVGTFIRDVSVWFNSSYAQSIRQGYDAYSSSTDPFVAYTNIQVQ